MAHDRSTLLTSYLPYLLRQADQTLSAPFYEVLTDYGIARSEWRVLAVLAELGELGVVDLADHALSPQPTVTHALRRLEERGLVRRTPGIEDKRQRLVSITPTGSTVAASLIAEAMRLEAAALAEAGDLSDLKAQLQELTAAVRAATERPTTEVKEAS